MSEHGFRAHMHPLDHPRIADLHGHDHHSHAKHRMGQALPRQLFLPWNDLYAQPYRGITTDGVVIPNLNALGANGAPSEAMFNAATALIAALPHDLQHALCLRVDADEWRRWNNTEIYMHPYGLRLDELEVAHRTAVLEVVRASLSAHGYGKIRDVMRMNHFLGELVGNTKVLGEYSYNFSLFGHPSRQDPWGWQLFGHHLALNCLVLGEQMTITPTFMGAEPDHADEGPYPRHRLFEDEEQWGLELMRSLSPDLQARALTYREMAPGPGSDMPPERWHRADQRQLGGAFQDNRLIPYEGVRGGELSRTQQTRLLDLVAAYLAPLPEGPLQARMETVERHMAETWFSWIGPFEPNRPFYYRIQSPVTMIEFDHHSGVFLANEQPEPFHVHTIVRTPNGGDYGMDLLGLHYQQAHQGRRPGGA